MMQTDGRATRAGREAAPGRHGRAWALALALTLAAGAGASAGLAGCGETGRKASSTSAPRGPSKILSGSGTIPGDKGFSLAQGVATPRKSGDFEFDDGDLVIRVPAGGAVDLGPVEFESVGEAPGGEYYRQVQAVVGHVYCLQLRTAEGELYAKLKVTQCVRQRHLGLTGGQMQFDYALQTNASRSFRPHVPEPTTQETLGRQVQALARRRSELETALREGVPQFQKKLAAQAGEVRDQLGQTSLSAEVRATLERELREIARLMVALEGHADRCRQTLALVGSAQRQLERLSTSEKLMGEQAGKLLDQVQEIERSAAVLVETQLTTAGLKGGTVEDLQVDRKVGELRK